MLHSFTQQASSEGISVRALTVNTGSIFRFLFVITCRTSLCKTSK